MKNRIKPVVNQYYSEKQYSLYIPLYILLSVLLISLITTLFIGINEGLPLTKESQLEFAQNNTAPIFSFPAFLVVAGALCVNRQFSAALASGSTRN